MPTPKRKPTREQARSWLATVFNPMRRALDVEADFVGRRNWSFRADSQDFEYLWPSAMMVAAPHRANAEQVFRYYPSLRQRTASHDAALTKLRDACRATFQTLIQSPAFQNLPMPNEQHLEPALERALPDARKYFAEYVINGLRDVPSHYVFADFWRAHGRQYLDLRTNPSLVSFFSTVETAGRTLQQNVDGLGRDVKKLQELLADKAGLPVVDPELA